MKRAHLTRFIFCFIFIMSINSQAQIIGVVDSNGSSSNNNPNNLNDADTYTRDNYIHSGYQQRELDEACKGNTEACGGQDVGSPYAAILGKAYGMIVGAIGGEFKVAEKGGAGAAKPEAAKADGAKPEGGEEKKTKSDNCKYIAIGTEVLAMFQQQSAQQNLADLPSNTDTAQKDQLFKAAMSHEERAENAKMQIIGWGATSICYTYATMAGIQFDWNIGLKLVGSYALLAFYISEKEKHDKAADGVRKIANKLPGKGDCNPISDTACYCAQPETQNDVQYCMPQIRKRQVAATSTQISCLTNKLKADPKCSCLANNTCYDTEFVSKINSLGFGSNFNKSVTKPFSNLTRGELVGANAAGGTNQTSALARQGLRKVANKYPNFNGNLSNKQKSQASLLASKGVPASLAALFASKSPRGSSKYNNRFRGGSLNRVARYSGKRGSRNSVLRFGGGNGLQNKKQKRRGTNFKKLFGKNKKVKKGGSVVKFRSKAVRSAEISKNTSANVFDIISRRYMTSGWSRLELR
ncbi:MAG: hypothetical protein HN576_11745 [Bacteriovoracaceae bacterium]|nr:hypothetical protein [Bacteriovoracaceae bacterium]